MTGGCTQPCTQKATPRARQVREVCCRCMPCERLRPSDHALPTVVGVNATHPARLGVYQTGIGLELIPTLPGSTSPDPHLRRQELHVKICEIFELPRTTLGTPSSF
jgi:hypothetical protein